MGRQVPTACLDCVQEAWDPVVQPWGLTAYDEVLVQSKRNVTLRHQNPSTPFTVDSLPNLHAPALAPSRPNPGTPQPQARAKRWAPRSSPPRGRRRGARPEARAGYSPRPAAARGPSAARRVGAGRRACSVRAHLTLRRPGTPTREPGRQPARVPPPPLRSPGFSGARPGLSAAQLFRAP